MYFLLLAALAGALITTTGFMLIHADKPVPVTANHFTVSGDAKTSVDAGCNFDFERLKGYEYISPLMFASKQCESVQLEGLKADLEKEIESDVNNGEIKQASVYIRDLNSGEWTGINEEATYMPGSLIKLATMLTVLKKTEDNPSLFNKKFKIDYDKLNVPMQTYNSKTVEDGKVYSLRELLQYMIAYSDNYATDALHSIVTPKELVETFKSLGIKVPVPSDNYYALSVGDYARFFEVLYNTGYLTNANSEYAMSLMAQCDFHDGMTKKLPGDIVVAHKFGEQISGDVHMLGEGGVVYLHGKPYLAIIFTKGADVKKQADVIAETSKKIFDRMKG